MNLQSNHLRVLNTKTKNNQNNEKDSHRSVRPYYLRVKSTLGFEFRQTLQYNLVTRL